ncbi:MAG: mandelate racemase/muconate lactonizing enzyme family protein [Caldilineaceae bacterium]|nr:mandelate racemase/muconate lactonizing enzyme family protein [Caldilineaceae bacterium]
MEGRSALKITDIKIVRLKTVKELGFIEPAWDKGGRMPFSVGGVPIVEIHTDAGLVGIGPGVEESQIGRAREILVGQDPFDMERHEAVMRYYIGGDHYRGRAGLDIALWDLIGKISGQPLYKIWGGAKDKVPAYASMVRLSTIEERVELATRLVAEGWKAIKLRLHYETIGEDIELVERVREAVGDRMEIMVDANQAQSSGNWQPGLHWDFRRAVETARELQRLNVYWLEEPLPRYYFDQLARLGEKVEMPIAGGENNPGIHEFVQMLEKNVYGILQPEGMVLGGMTPVRRVAILADAYGKKVVPHHGGRGLGTVAHLHMVCALANAPYLELLHDPPIGEYQHGWSMFTEPPVVDSEGYVAAPQKPGLGVEINPDWIE